MGCVSYTYLIGWSKTRMFYYGVRYAAQCHPRDLWTSYFTSSSSVKEYRLHNGEPDIIQIRRTFSNVGQARLWEEKVLKRIDASGRSDFLNKANGRSIPPELSTHYGSANGMYGKRHTSETIEKMRKPKSIVARQNMKGSRPHVNQRGANNNAFKGFILTPHGTFVNLHEAAVVEGVNYSTIAYRINSISPKFEQYKRVL